MTEKEEIHVKTTNELESVVDQLIATGRTDAKLNFDADVLLDPRAWDILERLTGDHPASKPQAVDEIVSYSQDALEERDRRGFTYRVVEQPDKTYKAFVHMGCSGYVEPWDINFPDIASADEHAIGYIDQIILEAEEAGRADKAAAQAKDHEDLHPKNSE